MNRNFCLLQRKDVNSKDILIKSAALLKDVHGSGGPVINISRNLRTPENR